MTVKFLDPIREVPLNSANLEGYVTVRDAMNKTGLSRNAITNGIHHSRRIGSAVIGNARLVRLADVEALAVQE